MHGSNMLIRKRNLAVITLALSLSCIGRPTTAFSETQAISKSDRIEIIEALNSLASSIKTEDSSAMSALLSPNINGELRREIVETYEERFAKYDYTKYEFHPPASKKMKVLVPGSKVRVKASYSSEYTSGDTGSGSTNGMPANFTMEKLDGKWLVLDTDFYTLKRFIKYIVIIALSVVALLLFSSVFRGWMLVDCVKREFPKPDERTTRVLILIFDNIVGALIYYKMVKKKQLQYDYTKL